MSKSKINKVLKIQISSIDNSLKKPFYITKRRDVSYYLIKTFKC